MFFPKKYTTQIYFKWFLWLNVKGYSSINIFFYKVCILTMDVKQQKTVVRTNQKHNTLVTVMFGRQWVLTTAPTRMVVGFITTYAISAYHHWRCEFKSRSWQGVLDTTLCDKGCQWLETSLWFSHGTRVSSTNNTDRHDITEILLKEALNNITLTP
jgi:hypothetical protein